MIRKTIIILLTLSAVGTGYLWAESYLCQYNKTGYTIHGERVVYRRSQPGRTIVLSRRPNMATASASTTRGHAIVSMFYHPARSILRLLPSADINPQVRLTRWAGFSFVNGTLAGRETAYVSAAFPLWSAFALFAAYPSIAFVRGPLRRFRRRHKGLCLACGYNLRGLTENRCPECGTEFER